MQTSTSLMIDLETLSTEPNAVVLAVGWCFFNRDGILHSRKVVLDAKQQNGREISISTLQFWAMGDPALFLEMLSGTATVAQLYWDLKSDIDNWGVDQWWANPAAFDGVILQSLFNENHFSPLWTHRNWMCFRTFMKERPNAERIAPTRAHDPEADAIAQADTVRQIWQNDYIAKLDREAQGWMTI